MDDQIRADAESPEHPMASVIQVPPNPLRHDDPAPEWTPLSTPTWTPVAESSAPTPPTEAPRYALPPRSFRSAVWAVIAVVIASLVSSFAADRASEHVDGGTLPAFLLSAVVLLITNVIVLGALYHFGIKRGVSTRSLGLTSPKDRTTAAVLAGASWIAFLFIAAIWVVITTPAAELRAQQESMFPRNDSTEQSNSFDDILKGIDQTDPSGSDALDGDSENESLAESTVPTASDDIISEASSEDAPAVARDNRHVLLKVLGDDPPLRIVILIIIAACILAPIVEELFFRGFLFSTMAAKFGVPLAALLSGSLFGLAHVEAVPLHLLPVLATLGILLAFLRDQTASLLPGMAVHAFVNGLGTGISADFGVYTIALIVGSWLVIAVVVRPFVRRNSVLPPPLPHAV